MAAHGGGGGIPAGGGRRVRVGGRRARGHGGGPAGGAVRSVRGGVVSEGAAGRGPELLGRARDVAWLLQGRCRQYGEGITFAPLVEALAGLGNRPRPVLERLGVGGAATPDELFWEARRMFDAMAAERPVILHIDDLQ